MVLLEKLKEVDSSFRIRSREGQDEQITTLCNIDHLHEGGIVFIKDKKFYKELMDACSDSKLLSTIGVIFEELFFKTSSAAGHLDSLNQFRFYATVASVISPTANKCSRYLLNLPVSRI